MNARRLFSLALLPIGLLLSGCVVGPDYAQPLMAMPAAWRTTQETVAKAPELQEWWRNLRDPMLDDLVAEAIAGNLDVASAKAAIREARASYRQTRGGLFPSISGSGSAIRSKASQSAGGGTGDQFVAGLDASWEVDLFGANRRALETAHYGAEAAEDDLRDTMLTLIGDVAVNYVEVRGYQAQIALARSAAYSQNETAKLTQAKLDAGAASAVDVVNARGLAASTAADVPSLQTSLAEAVNRLAVLTGRPAGALNERLEKSKPIPAPKLPLATGVPADVLLARPDTRAAERRYAQSTAKVGQAQAARYPSISLTGDIATTSTKLGDIAKSSSISWSFGPTLSVPVFNGGQLAAAVEVAQAQRDQAFVAWKSSVLGALEDVENALVGLANERRRSGQLTASANAYRQAASMARTRYDNGEADFLTVLDAQRSLYSAETAVIGSRVLLASYYIALNKALGGGWSGTVDVDRPEIVDAGTGPHLASAKP